MKLRRILVTTDAVGGVWRYSVDLACGLGALGSEVVLLGFGPRMSLAQRMEAERAAAVVWTDLPLDWMARDEAELAGIPEAIARHVAKERADIVQVNLPSQAARLALDIPVVAAAHSCVASWFRMVRGTGLPSGWDWQWEYTRRGFAQADCIVAPSRSFAGLLARCYPGVGPISVVPNATALGPGNARKQRCAYAAARWWDEAKNASALDAAAGACRIPIYAAGAHHGPEGQTVEFSRARHLGQLDMPTLVELASSASVFVSPSIYEPFGLAALEAAARGAALVLSDIPTYRELWDEAALFADTHDAAGFAAAIERLVEDAELRRSLTSEAGRRAAALTPLRQAERMLALYGSLVPQTAGAA